MSVGASAETAPDLGAELRLALRRMAKSVAVITSRRDGVRYAMAATAVSELSMEPPSMLIAVNQSASIYAPLSAGADFCINVLALDQEPIARSCGGSHKGEERFELGEWGEAAGGIPVLAGAQANIVCRNADKHVFGTHGVFMGEVIEVRRVGGINPLVYLDGKYTSAALPD